MAKNQKSYWLVKTEPDAFSVGDWERLTDRTTCWDGVRNYQARNFLRDSLKVGDRALVYHSSTDPCGVVGTAVVTRAAYPDHTAWDAKNPHFDPASTPENPRWFMVDLRLETIFHSTLTLDQLREVAALKNMELLRRGSRLSVQPVREREFEVILKLAAKG